jgi:hypothetical protein
MFWDVSSVIFQDPKLVEKQLKQTNKDKEKDK